MFWKAFQKAGQQQGLEAPSPRLALQAAYQVQFILPSEEPIWVRALQDRNPTSHVYQQQLAIEIAECIVSSYVTVFEAALGSLQALVAASAVPTAPQS